MKAAASSAASSSPAAAQPAAADELFEHPLLAALVSLVPEAAEVRILFLDSPPRNPPRQVEASQRGAAPGQPARLVEKGAGGTVEPVVLKRSVVSQQVAFDVIQHLQRQLAPVAVREHVGQLEVQARVVGVDAAAAVAINVGG